MSRLLEAIDISKRFGGLQAVEGVAFGLAAGEIRLILGPNGAGKTTFFNLISGVDVPDRGQVLIEGEEFTGRPAHHFAAAGLMRTFQKPRPFRGLSLVENVMVGAHARTHCGTLRGTLRTPFARREERQLRERSEELLAEVGLNRLDRLGGELTLIEERRLELARCLAGEPKILLLDEPAAGLGDEEAAEIAGLIQRIRDQRGLGVVLIEHHLDLALQVAEHVMVLDFGKVIATGAPGEIRSDPAVIEAYIGAAT